MLKGKNVVIVKSEGKKDKPLVQIYDRVYLEYSSSDILEKYTKTSEGKDVVVLNEAGQPVDLMRPAAAETTAPASDLVPEALAYFQEKFPVDAAKLKHIIYQDGKEVSVDLAPEDQAQVKSNYAWLMLLSAASYGADLWTRNWIQASIRPTKPITEEDARAKLAKTLTSAGKTPEEIKMFLAMAFPG